MKQTVVLALSILTAAVVVALAVVSLNAHVRALSDDLTSLTREVGTIREEVQALADDVAVLTETLTQEEGEVDGEETCPSDI